MFHSKLWGKISKLQNATYISKPHFSFSTLVNLQICLFKNNVLSLCTPYLVMKRVIGPIDNMTPTDHSQLVDESIIRLVHQPHMTENRPFYYRDNTRPLPIVIYANLNFLLPYPHVPLCEEHAAPARAHPELPIMEANSIPEIIAMALKTLRDQLMLTNKMGDKTRCGATDFVTGTTGIAGPCDPPPRVMLI